MDWLTEGNQKGKESPQLLSIIHCCSTWLRKEVIATGWLADIQALVENRQRRELVIGFLLLVSTGPGLIQIFVSFLREMEFLAQGRTRQCRCLSLVSQFSIVSEGRWSKTGLAPR